MGFDVTRFIGEIDEEFQCSICKMVLEDAVQTPCDHLFCSECIKHWLSMDKSCPVDRQSLAKTDLKPINRSLRNLLNKLEIKCDSQGCNGVVKFEYLQSHLASCEYNPDARIVCDKGCNLEMSRREYQMSNCLTHLTFSHKKEIASLLQELANQKENLARQKEHFDSLINHQEEEIGRLSNEVVQLRHEKDQLVDLKRVTSRQEEEIKKLSEEVQQFRRQQNQVGASTQHEIATLNDGAEISPKPPIKWEWISNIKSPLNQLDVLEVNDKSTHAYVRSSHPLEPKNSSFKVEVLNEGFFNIGLYLNKVTTRKYSVEWYAVYMSFYKELYVNGACKMPHEGSKCKTGDIIEFGIKFPSNFVKKGKGKVNFYVSINERVVTEKVYRMPVDAIYPAILIKDNTKLRYFGI